MHLMKDIQIQANSLPIIEVKNIHFHSKSITKGDLFIAISGSNQDGHQYIQEAITRGAAVIIGENDSLPLPVPYIRVKDARETLGKMATIYYGNPSRSHKMIGITGTNGKTTTAYMIHHILRFAGHTCSLIGTLGSLINGETYETKSTTPDAITLQKLLCASNDHCVVMEVSSHGIHQKRIEGTKYDYALFTNLSHEHLDYHSNLDEYFKIKSSLFEKLKTNGEAIVNSSCPWGERLIEKLRTKNIPLFTFGHQSDDDLQLLSSKGKAQQIMTLKEQEKLYTIKLPLPGAYNVSNAMASILLARRMGIEFDVIKEGFEGFKGTPGRLEIYKHQSNIDFIIDYAHTPDGLEQCLKAIHELGYRRIIHIFGFRGKRDVLKRKQMIDISDCYSEQVILTLDDLNGVSIEEMIGELDLLSSQCLEGKAIIHADRTEAILYAWENALPGDCLVITGKGPETYQQSFSLPTRTDQETIHYILND